MGKALRSALVTGASGGLGKSIAIDLARSGVDYIHVHYNRDARGARETCQAVKREGVRADVIQGDLTQEDDIVRIAEKASNVGGGIDILINNAGTTRRVPVHDLEGVSREVWKQIMQTNLYAPFALTRILAPSLRSRHGTIINIASDSAFSVNGSSIPYCVSKAGLVHLTRLLAAALAPDVSVNCVAPGFVNTRWLERVYGEKRESLERNGVIAGQGGLLESEDVARAVLAIISAGSSVTGQTIIVDGGACLVRDVV